MKAGSHSHLHIARSEIFLLKLQMMARALRLERRVTILETVGLPINRHPHMEEEVGFEPTEGFPSPPFQDGAIGLSAILPSSGVSEGARTLNAAAPEPQSGVSTNSTTLTIDVTPF